MKRVIVCGGREFDDWALLDHVLSEHLLDYWSVTIVQGGAKGADFLARTWARLNCFFMEEYPANWKEYGKAAGHIRNKIMAEQNIDMVIAFPGGSGTESMKKIAKEKGIELIVVNE